jgi:hypothetical protein
MTIAHIFGDGAIKSGLLLAGLCGEKPVSGASEEAYDLVLLLGLVLNQRLFQTHLWTK